MRQTAARPNRAWLIILGLLLLIGGLVVVAIGTGLFLPAITAAGLSATHPAPGDQVVAATAGSVLTLTWVVVLVALAGVVVALLGLWWLLVQIPRSNQAKPFRLHDDARTGLTRCAPSVLTDAVETQIRSLPGVHNASAVIRGTAQQPDLTVKVTASDRTDLPRLLTILQNRVAADLAGSLDTQLARLGVRFEIDTTTTRTDHITV